MEQQEIIDTLVRTVKSSGIARGMRYEDLRNKVMFDSHITKDEMDDAFLFACDNGILSDIEPGWVRMPEKEPNEDQAREAREDRARDDERRYDINRQHAAEGQ